MAACLFDPKIIRCREHGHIPIDAHVGLPGAFEVGRAGWPKRDVNSEPLRLTVRHVPVESAPQRWKLASRQVVLPRASCCRARPARRRYVEPLRARHLHREQLGQAGDDLRWSSTKPARSEQGDEGNAFHAVRRTNLTFYGSDVCRQPHGWCMLGCHIGKISCCRSASQSRPLPGISAQEEAMRVQRPLPTLEHVNTPTLPKGCARPIFSSLFASSGTRRSQKRPRKRNRLRATKRGAPLQAGARTGLATNKNGVAKQ